VAWRPVLAVAAGVVGSCGFVLGSGHLLSTATFDLAAWMAVLVVTARVLRTGDGRWWIGFGAVAGVAMLNKDLVVLLAATIALGLLVARRWRLLATPWLPAGAALAVLIASPNLVWQARHDWPQVATVDNGLDVDNEVQGTPILVCRGLRAGWAET
jgi:4-amino-4-deoxy-L-arabinose transferase-like glycosyltransferase